MISLILLSINICLVPCYKESTANTSLGGCSLFLRTDFQRRHSFVHMNIYNFESQCASGSFKTAEQVDIHDYCQGRNSQHPWRPQLWMLLTVLTFTVMTGIKCLIGFYSLMSLIIRESEPFFICFVNIYISSLLIYLFICLAWFSFGLSAFSRLIHRSSLI